MGAKPLEQTAKLSANRTSRSAVSSFLGGFAAIVQGGAHGAVTGTATWLLFATAGLLPIFSVWMAFALGLLPFLAVLSLTGWWYCFLVGFQRRLGTANPRSRIPRDREAPELFFIQTAEDARTRKWVVAGSAGQVLLAAVLAAGLYGSTLSRKQAQRDSVESKIAGLRQNWDHFFGSFATDGAGTPPQSMSKFVIVDLDTRDLDPLMTKVAPTFIASSETELKHLLRVRRTVREVGRFDSGGSAFQRVCLIEVVDYPSQRVVFGETLEGGQPPTFRRRRAGGSTYGSDPLEDWLRGFGVFDARFFPSSQTEEDSVIR